MLNRRDLGGVIAGALAGNLVLPAAAEGGPPPTHIMPPEMEAMRGRGETAVMLLYPGMTALDFVAPQYAFASIMGLNVHHVAASMEPVVSDTKLTILPTTTFDECPAEPTILFVPGGTRGTLAAIRDPATLRFVAERGARAGYVTSVCTGSLILGAAGLLRGYRATSHWLTRELLREAGAEPTDARVVTDRDRITGAGVTAGFDLGLTLAARLRGEDYARAVALLAEYAPEPPFRAGTPAEAGPETTKLIADMFTAFRAEARETLAASAGARP